jgi:hypothetical protein
MTVTKLKLILIPKNKQQLHCSQSSCATQLRCVWHKRLTVLSRYSSGGFLTNFKVTMWYKMFKHTRCANVLPSLLCVVVVCSSKLTVNVMLLSLFNVVYIDMSNFQSMCAVSSMTIFCSSLRFHAFPLCCLGIFWYGSVAPLIRGFWIPYALYFYC